MKQAQSRPRNQPPQHQRQRPGVESEMEPQPRFAGDAAPQKLHGKVALITGGDSGIGRAVAVAFAREGAHVSIVYLEERGDAEDTRAAVQALGRRCVAL